MVRGCNSLQVLHALKDSAGFTLPDLAGVVRAAEREVAEEEQRERRVQQKEAARHRMMNEAERREMPVEMLASASSEAGAEPGDGTQPPVMSLQEAVADVRCKIAVQLLLVQVRATSPETRAEGLWVSVEDAGLAG